jgi:hypothetical protein
MLKNIGLQKPVDDFVLSMNRGADAESASLVSWIEKDFC